MNTLSSKSLRSLHTKDLTQLQWSICTPKPQQPKRIPSYSLSCHGRSIDQPLSTIDFLDGIRIRLANSLCGYPAGVPNEATSFSPKVKETSRLVTKSPSIL